MRFDWFGCFDGFDCLDWLGCFDGLDGRQGRGDGVVLNDNFCRIAEVGGEEFLASELGQGHVCGYFVAVSAKHAVDDEHGCNSE